MKQKAFIVYDKNNYARCSICDRICEHGKDIKKEHKQHEIINLYEPIQREDILYYKTYFKDNKIEVRIYNETNCIFTFSFNKYGEIISDNIKEASYWLEWIENNFFYKEYGNKNRFLSFSDDDCKNLYKWYPSIYQYTNLSKFIKMISTRKILSKNIDTTKLDKIAYSKIDLNVGKKYDKKEVKLCKLKEYTIDKEVVFEVIYAIGYVLEGKIINPEKYRFFISKDFIYNPKKYDLSKIIGKDNKIQAYERVNYSDFQKTYPEVKLKEFVNSGGKDIVRFILSNNNDNIFELIGKAGLGLIAENSHEISINNNGKNIKEIFGLPIKALKTLNSEKGVDLLKNYISLVKEIYLDYPSIFYENITDSGYHALKDYKYLLRFDNFLKCFRYINNIDESEYSDYIDYLRMCNNEKLYPYGKYPNNIKIAHDTMMVYIEQKKESLIAEGFENVISLPNYRNLEYETENYKFLLPRNPDDLVTESYQMRNCVRSYINSVANNYLYIVFLRKKGKLSNSFVTISVRNNYYLDQVKGKGNSIVDKETAELVIEWCREKGIRWDCYDINTALKKIKEKKFSFF